MLVSGIGVVGNGAGHGIPPNGVVSMGMVVGVEGSAMVPSRAGALTAAPSWACP